MKLNEVRDQMNRTRSARRGTELRALLRSRPVQVVLGATVVAHGVAIAAGPRTAGDSADAAARTARVEAAPVLLPTAGAGAAAGAAAADAVALELAGKYRAKGYRVPDLLAKQIYTAAKENDVDPAIAFGLVAVESGFRRTARSHVGATGLAQLMPATARWLEPGTTRSHLEDPETNLRLGFRYLRQMIDRYDGDTHLALLAYNRGPGTVDRVLRRGGNPDNGYPRKVMGE